MTSNEAGILTFAFGAEYQRQAYCQALTAKKFLGLPMSVVIPQDHATNLVMLKKLGEVANIIFIKGRWATFEYEQLALDLTPYELTYKTDADVLFPRGAGLYHQGSLPASSGVATDVRGFVNQTSPYRTVEASLGAPAIYSACFAFNKRSPKAQEFFATVKDLYRDWFRLKLWERTEVPLQPTTDTVYSIAWLKVFGLTRIDGNEFIHAKPEICGWTDAEWTKNNVLMVDDGGRMFLQGTRLTKPFHYYDKSLITDEFIGRLEDVCLVRTPTKPKRSRSKSSVHVPRV